LMPSVWRMTALPKKLFWENFSILCEHCWWKLLVCFKTFIYCKQLCNNVVNYPIKGSLKRLTLQWVVTRSYLSPPPNTVPQTQAISVDKDGPIWSIFLYTLMSMSRFKKKPPLANLSVKNYPKLEKFTPWSVFCTSKCSILLLNNIN
jgi:hypothetical protein